MTKKAVCIGNFKPRISFYYEDEDGNVKIIAPLPHNFYLEVNTLRAKREKRYVRKWDIWVDNLYRVSSHKKYFKEMKNDTNISSQRYNT